MNEKIIENLKENPYFQEFQLFILEKINELDSITHSDIVSMNNKQAGEIVRVHAKAIELFESVLQPLIDFKQRREHTEEEIKNAKAKVGL